MKKFETEFKWAVYFMLLLFIWFYMEKLMGLHANYVRFEGIFSILILAPQAFLYHFALRQKREKYFKGNISWKQAFFSGAILTLIIAGLSPIVSYSTTAVISPEFMDNLRMQTGQSKDIYSANRFSTDLLFSLLSNGIVIAAIMAILIRQREKTKNK